MRRVFLLSLLLVALSLLIPWLAVTLTPAGEEASPPAPSVPVSDNVAPDGATPITALCGDALIETTMADWLPGVVAAEMPASFAPEALRAQAVAARTYILRRVRGGGANHPEAGICDRYTCCCAHKDDAALRAQWGKDYAHNMARIRQAVADTDGQYLVYDGQLIRAVFHAASAGSTECSTALWGGDAPYLVSVSSPETAQDVPNYVSTAEIAADAVQDAVLDRIRTVCSATIRARGSARRYSMTAAAWQVSQSARRRSRVRRCARSFPCARRHFPSHTAAGYSPSPSPAAATASA